MASYTTQLRTIAENLTNKTKISEVISAFSPILFDFDYPYPSEMKEVLQDKIISHYYTREIGLETWELFHLEFKNRMREIMPMYDAKMSFLLAEKQTLFDNYKMNENTQRNLGKTGNTDEKAKSTASGDSNSSGTNVSVTHDKDRESDTPQGSISDLENDRYMTRASITDSSDNSTSESASHSESESDSTRNVENVENVVETIVKSAHGRTGGKTGIELLEKVTDEMLNIESQIIRKMNVCFMSIY